MFFEKKGHQVTTPLVRPGVYNGICLTIRNLLSKSTPLSPSSNPRNPRRSITELSSSYSKIILTVKLDNITFFSIGY